MKVAIFGKTFRPGFNSNIIQLFKKLNDVACEIFIYKPFYNNLIEKAGFEPKIDGFFTNYDDLPESIDFFISIGGDGTFLESVLFVRDKNIPIVGINTGRLGFLSDISKEEIIDAITSLTKADYDIEDRTLLSVNTNTDLFKDFNCALNEVTVHKRDTSSMMTVQTFVNDKLLNSYWADGLTYRSRSRESASAHRRRRAIGLTRSACRPAGPPSPDAPDRPGAICCGLPAGVLRAPRISRPPPRSGARRIACGPGARSAFRVRNHSRRPACAASASRSARRQSVIPCAVPAAAA